MRELAALLAMGTVLAGQTASFREETFQGRRAFVLENDLIRVSTLPGGGFIGEIRFKSGDPKTTVNPMRVPHYPTIDPHEYEEAKHGALYGADIQRRLMSGYMGHFLCFPNYGPSSEAEFQNDYGQHGEALAVEWKRRRVDQGEDGVTLLYSADLPKTQYRVERSITLLPGESVGYIEESIENLVPYDRPINWVQHITFGPPFLEPGRNIVDASVEKVAIRDGKEFQAGAWPVAEVPGGDKVDFRLFPATPNSGRYNVWLLDRSKPRVWFAMYNPAYPVLIGYVFPSADNWWVGDWQENQRATKAPWDGKVIARGVDVGTTPLAAGLRPSVEMGTLLGAPTYRWIQARERLSKKYLFFLAAIPPGFKGVADLQLRDGRIALVERDTGNVISVKSARDW
ncbi:MAG: hypothetical protein KIT09_11910 [Bryobacteraceae bacterium]|nr:hypothetical protein [Bryobacteraceae bacterium]